MSNALKRITTKNLDAILIAAKAELGMLAVPCTDGKIRIWRTGSSSATDIYAVYRERSSYIFRKI